MAISLGRYQLVYFFKILVNILFQETVWMTVYASVQTLCEVSYARSWRSINVQACVIITIWACLAFQNRATYIQTSEIFDIKVSSVPLTGKKRPLAPGKDECRLPPEARGLPQSVLRFPGSWRWNTPGYFRARWDMSSLNVGLACCVSILFLGPEGGRVLSPRPGGLGVWVEGDTNMAKATHVSDGG